MYSVFLVVDGDRHLQVNEKAQSEFKTKKELNSLLLKVLEGATSWKALEPLRAIGLRLPRAKRSCFLQAWPTIRKFEYCGTLSTLIMQPLTYISGYLRATAKLRVTMKALACRPAFDKSNQYLCKTSHG